MKKKINLARAYVVRAKGITRAVLKRHGMTTLPQARSSMLLPRRLAAVLMTRLPPFLTWNTPPPSVSISGSLFLICCRPVTGWSETSTKPTITSAGIN